MKMKELEARTGVGREAIRYYIREGLLPEPQRPKRNVALYTDDHVSRIQAIKRLQAERFLPLGVIKAFLNADVEEKRERALARGADAFPHLEDLLLARFNQGLVGENPTLSDVARRACLSEDKIQEMARVGIIELIPDSDQDGETTMSARDAAITQLWGELNAVGFTDEKGFTCDTAAIYADFVDWLTGEELALFFKGMAGDVDEPQAALAAEKGILIVNEILGLMRTRTLLKKLGELRADTGSNSSTRVKATNGD